jgi:hypothetical protein
MEARIYNKPEWVSSVTFAMRQRQRAHTGRVCDGVCLLFPPRRDEEEIGEHVIGVHIFYPVLNGFCWARASYSVG